MTDFEDDWMNPPTVSSFTTPEVKDGTFYQIQRKRAIPVTGNVSHVHRWEFWREFEDRAKRDAELAHLRKIHPAWHLRARTINRIHGQEIGPDPFEYRDA